MINSRDTAFQCTSFASRNCKSHVATGGLPKVPGANTKLPCWPMACAMQLGSPLALYCLAPVWWGHHHDVHSSYLVAATLCPTRRPAKGQGHCGGNNLVALRSGRHATLPPSLKSQDLGEGRRILLVVVTMCQKATGLMGEKKFADEADFGVL